MAFLYGFSGGLIAEPPAVSTTVTVYAPTQAPTPDILPIYEVLPDVWDQIDGKQPIETVWKSVLLYLSGQLLRLWENAYGKSLRTIPVLSQRKWVRFKLLESQPGTTDPGGTYTGIAANYAYSASAAAITGNWVPRVGADVYSLPLTSSMTDAGSFTWTTEITPSALPTGGGGLFVGYFKRAGSTISDGIAVGIGFGDKAFIAQIDDVGNTAIQLSAAGLLSTATRYELAAQYLGHSTNILSLTVTEKSALLVIRVGALQGGIALSNGSADGFTDIFQDVAVNYVTLGVSVGDTLQVIDEDGITVLHSDSIKTVATDTLVLQNEALVVGDATIKYKVVGDSIVETLAMDVASSATDERFSSTSFGTFSLDMGKLTPTGTTWTTGLGVVAGTAVAADIHQFSYLDTSVRSETQDIPYLQPNPLSQTGLLTSGSDFKLSGSELLFQTPPTTTLHAEYVRYDERVIEANFGSAVSLLGASTESYLAAVRGLFFAHWKGPTVNNIRRGVHIYLGLPIALAAGIVEAVNTTYSGEFGLIRVSGTDYLYPRYLGTSLSVSDPVEAYQPLCNGVQVEDYLSKPLWWLPYSSTGFNEIQKFHTFQVVIDADIVDLSSLGNALNFVNRMKPTWKDAFILLLKVLEDTLTISDVLFLFGEVIIQDPVFPFATPRYDATIALPGLSMEVDGYDPLFRGNPAVVYSRFDRVNNLPSDHGWERLRRRDADDLWISPVDYVSLDANTSGRIERHVLHDQTRSIPETVSLLIWENNVVNGWTRWEDDGNGVITCTSHPINYTPGDYYGTLNYDLGGIDFTLPAGTTEFEEIYVCYANQYLHTGSANTVAVPFADYWYDQTPNPDDPGGDRPDYSLLYIDPTTAPANLNDTDTAAAGYTWPRSGTDVLPIGVPDTPGSSVSEAGLPGRGATTNVDDTGMPGSSDLLIVAGIEVITDTGPGVPPDLFYDGYPESGPDELLFILNTNLDSGAPHSITWMGTPSVVFVASETKTATEIETTGSYP